VEGSRESLNRHGPISEGLHMKLFEWFTDWLIQRALKRRADFVIGGWEQPYMLRWWLTPWSGVARTVRDEQKTWWQWTISKLPGVYLHWILRSDDDRALHDHPWANCSIVLRGSYIEHTIDAGGVHQRALRTPGSIVLRRAKQAHRLEILESGPCWSLFVHGFRLRHWGFHCPHGWVHWKQFTAANDPGAIGKGCGV
jgi:hypothetical protein